MKNKAFLQLAPLITVVAIIAVWWCIALSFGAEIILPTPQTVAKSFARCFTQKAFYKSIIFSLLRVFASFFFALCLGVILALIAVYSRFMERLLYPLVVIVRATPTMSIIFLCIIWFSRDISPMIVAFTIIFPMLYTSTLTAIKSCDDELLQMSKIYQVPKKHVILKLYLPSVAGRVFSDSVNAISLNVKLIIAAEALAQTPLSLGDSMKIAKEALETAELFAYTITAILISFLLEFALRGIKVVFVRWYYANA